MTQFIGYCLIAVVVAALLFYAAIAFLPQGLTVTPVRDDVSAELPTGRLVTRDDLVAVRLPVVLRGYRMADTDDLLDRLTLEIAARDRELEQLRADLAAAPVAREAADADADADAVDDADANDAADAGDAVDDAELGESVSGDRPR